MPLLNTVVDAEQPQDSRKGCFKGHGRIIQDVAGNVVDIQLGGSGDSNKGMGATKYTRWRDAIGARRTLRPPKKVDSEDIQDWKWRFYPRQRLFPK